MQYGYFDEKNKEFVITRPDTPTPWINYLGNDEYCGLISNTAGGYSFYKDPRDRRITRFRYNNLPIDRPGRYLYLRDDKTKDFWSLGWQPAQKPMNKFKYECRHGLGYTTITSTYANIQSKATYFVPLGENLEVWIVEIENRSRARKKLSLFSYLEFCMWNAVTDMTDFQYTLNIARARCKDNVIYHSTSHYPHLKQKNIAYFSASKRWHSFDCDRERFIGNYNSEANPEALKEGKCSNSYAMGGNPCAATHIKLNLLPGQKEKIVFILGFSESEAHARKFIKKYKNSQIAEGELNKLKKHWKDYLSKFQVRTPDSDVDLLVNTWNQYQCRTTFNWSRSASYYESGIGRGMGFRDTNQDTLGVVHSIPQKVKERICDLASNQFSKGSTYHQYFPLTKKGDGGGYSDDPLWLVLSVSAYLKESGDFKFLNTKVPFVEGKKATIYEHLCKAVDYVFNKKGPHSLPLAGFADWNDCLNLDGPKKQGESVMVAEQLCWAAMELSEISRICEKKDKAGKYSEIAKKMRRIINKVAWDGKWYLRAFNDDKAPVGSTRCKEGKIFLNTQSWALMSEVAGPKRAKLCMNMVKKFLDTEHGIILLTPPYTKYDPKIGAMGTFPPGLKENAGIFSHTNPWAVIAETILGRGDRAFDYYKKIAPTTRNKIADIHRTEGYIYSQFITGKHHPNFGEAKNSWLTGSAAWNLIAITQYILGIRPEYEGLKIDPCIPKDWRGFKADRLYRGVRYRIEVENPEFISKGVKEIYVNGKKIKGNLLPLFKDNKIHKVKVIMGTVRG